MSDTPDTLELALLRFQAEAPKPVRDAQNPHYRSRYLTLDHLLDEVLPVLNRCGLVVSQAPAATTEGRHTLTTSIIHAATGKALQSTMLLELPRDDPQGQGSALTYARRYALSAILGISSGDPDDDANAASQRTETGGKASEKQQEFILKLVAELDAKEIIPADAVLAGLKSEYGVDSIHALDKAQASDLIARLKAKAGGTE